MKTLKQWLDEYDNNQKLAGCLSVSVESVRHWRRGWVLPNSMFMHKLLILSSHQIDWNKTIKDHYIKSNKVSYRPKEKPTRAKPRKKTAAAKIRKDKIRKSK